MKLPLLCVIFALSLLVQASPNARFSQVECDNPNRFTKAQKNHIAYAYNFGAPRGMGYIMAAIAWQESCAGAYMVNFSDPSAGLYHAHIPVVLKYYSRYSDTPFTRNVMGQLLINDRKFASQVALDSLMYWHRYHRGDHKNIIKSYNKGFKWEKDLASNKLAESYYTNVRKKIRALELFIPKISRIKNRNTLADIVETTKPTPTKRTQNTRQSAQNSTPTNQARASKPTPKNNKPKPPKSPQSKSHQDNFVDLPLDSSQTTTSDQTSSNYDANFEDFTLIFEGY